MANLRRGARGPDFEMCSTQLRMNNSPSLILLCCAEGEGEAHEDTGHQTSRQWASRGVHNLPFAGPPALSDLHQGDRAVPLCQIWGRDACFPRAPCAPQVARGIGGRSLMLAQLVLQEEQQERRTCEEVSDRCSLFIRTTHRHRRHLTC